MKTARDHLIEIRNHLSDKERWLEMWESNRITGYSSGSLGNSLAGIWCTSYGTDKVAYPSAYACVGRAILKICGSDLLYSKEYNEQKISYDDADPYRANKSDLRLVHAFSYKKDHELLMQILDLSIQYASRFVY